MKTPINATDHVCLSLLAEPFAAHELKLKPGVVSGARCLAMPYVDARTVMDRLDAVMGVEAWQDDYEPLPDGTVLCRLRLLIGGQWIAKCDAGGPSEQPDAGDRRKAAVSDALKRAAVKFGIGRYLYRLEPQWVDYDPQRKRIVGKLAPAPAPRPVARLTARPTVQLPADGAELQERLYACDDRLSAAGLCRPGELMAHLAVAGRKQGYGPDLADWSGPAIAFAAAETRRFEAARRDRKAVA